MELMKSHQQNSQVEELCLQFHWGVSPDTPKSFYMHEEYANRKGFDEHAGSNHFARFMKFNEEKQPYIKPQVVGFYETIV